MLSRNVCFFLFILLLNGNHLAAQPSNLNFQHITPADGLSHSDVMDILQDRRGFIWLATRNGLNRYDGHSFKKYYANPEDNTSLSGNWLNTVAEDSLGNIWVSTYHNGVCRLDPKTGVFTNFHHDNSDPSSLASESLPQTLAIYVDQDGIVWVPTNVGLDRFDPATQGFRHFPEYQACLLQDNRGNHWFSSDIGLVRVNFGTGDRKVFPFEPQADGIVPDVVTMLEKEDGNFWLSSRSHGLFQLELSTGTTSRIHFQSIPGRQTIHSTGIRQMAIDAEGRLWMTSEGNGLFIWNIRKNEFHHYTHDPLDPYSISNNMTQSILIDRQQRVWIGIEGGGLETWHPHSLDFEYYQHDPNNPSSLSHNNVAEIYEDSLRNLWIGTWGGGLNYLDRKTGKFTRYMPDLTNPDSIPSMFSLDIFEGENGTPYFEFWVPNYGFITVSFENGKFQRYQVKDPRISGKVRERPPFIDSEGKYWYRLKRDSLLRFDPRSGEIDYFDKWGDFIFQDSRERIWITDGPKGVILFQPETETVTQFTHDPEDPNSIPGNLIDNIFEDSEGRIWLSTQSKGFCQIVARDSSYAFINYRSSNSGLPGDFVTGMKEDNLGYLWIGTYQGMCRFDPETEKFKNFRFLDGKESFNWFNPSQGKDGRLYFGGSNGFLVIDPESIQDNKQPPQMFITDFQINNHPVPVRGTFGDTLVGSSPLTEDIIFTKEIELTYRQNDLYFTFAALNYTEPMRNRYRYRLLGDSEEWIETDARRPFAFYTNLRHGTYTFEVQGTNNDGIWSTEPARLSIKIMPPWWRTWWAYSLYLILAFGIVYSIHQVQLSRKLKSAETRRLAELDAFKTRFYTNITHEFRTPITVIQGMADRISEEPEHWFRDGLAMIQRNSHQLLRLVDQMLNLSKLEAGRLHLKMVQSNIVPFLRYLTESFNSWAEIKHIHLSFHAEENPLLMDFDPLRLQQIMSNLLSNALKYTPKYGEISVWARCINHAAYGKNGMSTPQLEIKVNDTGQGIPEEQLDHIFECYYQALSPYRPSRNGEEPAKLETTTLSPGGVGIGLAFVKEMVHLMEGEITVQSKLEEGSSFIVHLPIRQEAPLTKKVFPDFESPRPEMGEERVTAFPSPGDARQTAPGEKDLLLIVEDNADVVYYLRSCLENRYRIITAPNGKAGLEKALEVIPDIIISDVMMPEMNGFVLCDKLKSDIRTSHVPILLLTAKADHDSRIEGLEKGADAYLSKPFDKKELEVRLRKLVELRRKLQERYGAGISSAEHTRSASGTSLDMEDTFLRELREAIEANISDEDYGIDELCRDVALSRTHLHRKLKALTGQSSSHYIRNIRLDKARQLLETTDLTVSEIAFEVGFSNLSHFSRLFSSRFEASPSTWKSEHRLVNRKH